MKRRFALLLLVGDSMSPAGMREGQPWTRWHRSRSVVEFLMRVRQSRGGGVARGLGCLVDLIGIEPMTSSMPWKRAPSCATGPRYGDFVIVADIADQVKHAEQVKQERGTKRCAVVSKFPE